MNIFINSIRIGILITVLIITDQFEKRLQKKKIGYRFFFYYE